MANKLKPINIKLKGLVGYVALRVRVFLSELFKRLFISLIRFSYTYTLAQHSVLIDLIV